MSLEAAFCPACGVRSQGGAFCIKCGANLTDLLKPTTGVTSVGVPTASVADPTSAIASPIASTIGAEPTTSPPWLSKAILSIVIGVAIVVGGTFVIGSANPKSSALSLVSTACSQAATWDQDLIDGSSQAGADQAAFAQTVQELTSKLAGVSISAPASSEMISLQAMSAGLFGYGASQECQTLQSQLQIDLGQ